MHAARSRIPTLRSLAVVALGVIGVAAAAGVADAAPCRMPKDPSIVMARRPLVDLGELVDVETKGAKCFYVVRLANGDTRTVDASRFTLRRAFDVTAAPDRAADVPEGFNGRPDETPSASIATGGTSSRQPSAPAPSPSKPSAAAPSGTTPSPSKSQAAASSRPTPMTVPAAPRAAAGPAVAAAPPPARTGGEGDSSARTWHRWIEPDATIRSSASPANHPLGCAMPQTSAEVVGRDGRSLGSLVKVEAVDERCLYWIRRHDDTMWAVDRTTVRLR